MQHLLNNFDWEIYLLNYPDLVDLETENDVCLHYIQIGYLENRTDKIPEIFDVEKYFNTYQHLRLHTARDAYIHFMKLGLMCHREGSKNPLHLLVYAQYNKIINHNKSLLIKPPKHVKPFVLPPKPKTTESSGPRIPVAPNAFNPPKEPLKQSRPTQTIFDQIQPKVMATTPHFKQQIQTTASSIIKPKPTQKPTIEPAQQSTLSQTRESAPTNTDIPKRQPQAPTSIHLPKELFRKPKPIQPIFDQVQPKVDVPNTIIKQKMHNTATSMMNPKEYFSRKAKAPAPSFPIDQEIITQPPMEIITKRPSIAFTPSKQHTAQRSTQEISQKLQPKVVHCAPLLKQKINIKTSMTTHKAIRSF